MAKIISHHALCFGAEGKHHSVFPSPHVQHVPSWVALDPYFKAAVESGWVEIHDEPEELKEEAKPKSRTRKQKPEEDSLKPEDD
jgi:hypothetical protein